MRRFVQAFDGATWPALPPAMADALATQPQRYNIAGRSEAAVLHSGEDGALRVSRFTWGLVPTWSKAPRTDYTTVTARLERAPRSRIFRGPWQHRRCVVPMNGYYKWDRSVRPHVPYFIQARDGNPLLAAGLWERWEKSEPALCSFAILTRANDAIPPPLVPDGPVFLTGDAWRTWIDGDPWFPQRFLARTPQPALEAYRVSRAIRDATRDDYTLLEPVDVDTEDASLDAKLDPTKTQKTTTDTAPYHDYPTAHLQRRTIPDRYTPWPPNSPTAASSAAPGSPDSPGIQRARVDYDRVRPVRGRRREPRDPGASSQAPSICQGPGLGAVPFSEEPGLRPVGRGFRATGTFPMVDRRAKSQPWARDARESRRGTRRRLALRPATRRQARRRPAGSGEKEARLE